MLQYDDGSRTLELNEGQAQHSICMAECDAGPAGPRRPSSVLTGDVWDGHLVDHFAARSEPPRRVAILGNAAGTTSRAYEEFFPRTRVDGVEIDSELSEIGRRYFDMNNPRLHLYHEDARPFLRRIDARYDVISVDAYRQPYIPFYLTTVEFFETVRDKLAPGGAVIVNVGHPEGQDELERVLSATIGEVFPHLMRDPIEDTNTLLVASEAPLSGAAIAKLGQNVAALRFLNTPVGQFGGHQASFFGFNFGVEALLYDKHLGASEAPLSGERIGAAAPRLPPALRPTAYAAAARLAPPLRGGDVYTDDKAPVEWLIDKSIVDYASGD